MLVGSEGTLAVVTKVTLRLLRAPESVRTLLAAFSSTDQAGDAVSAIIAAGIIPAAVEMMDRLTLEAAEAAVHPNFPKAEAVLIVELDGPASEVAELFTLVERVCRDHRCTDLIIAANDEDRARIWKGRKAAFAAMGRVSPNYYVQDGVIPRTKLPDVLRRIRELEVRSGLRIGNVFHAGDGNLHPLVCYDEGVPGQGELAEQVASEILTYCIDAGGSITGEHGIGADKAQQMPKMFTEADLDTMQLVRCAFDPQSICNPGKVFPTPRLCGEVPGPYRAHPPNGSASRSASEWSQRVPATAEESRRCSPRPTRRAVRWSCAVTEPKWAGASRRPSIGVDLSTTALNRVVAHRHGDLTATVESGAVLDDVNRELARHGQWIPLDPNWPDRATIGGIVSTNDSGPRGTATAGRGT